VSGRARGALAALAIAAALPALAYVLPVPGILKRMGERRAALSLGSLEVAGTLTAEGDAAERLAQAAGLRAAGGQVSAPAAFRMKVPGRCRLEVATPDAPETARPFVALRDGKLSGSLAELPAAVALVRAACTLLATPPGGEVAETYAAALGKLGVGVDDSSLGRFDGRIAYVVGGRQRDAARPLLFVAKDGFQPQRLVAMERGELRDVRLLGWGSPIGGEWFPRAVEVFRGEQLELRFGGEKVVPNPKLADALFP
jgi:hypothetical protein